MGQGRGAGPGLCRILPNSLSPSDVLLFARIGRDMLGLLVCFCLINPAGCWTPFLWAQRTSSEGRCPPGGQLGGTPVLPTAWPLLRAQGTLH